MIAGWWKGPVIGLLTLALLLGLAEGGLRLVGFRPRPPALQTLEAAFWITDARLGFRNRPNHRLRNMAIHGAPLVTTGSRGFRRGYGWPVVGDEPVIVFVGDSVLFGGEVADGETIPSQVARLLEARGTKVAVLNAGVRGYGSAQAMEMLAACLEGVPRIALAVYVYCNNDLLETVNPIVFYPATAPVLRWDGGARRFVKDGPLRFSQGWGQPLPARVSAMITASRRLREFSALFQWFAYRLRPLVGAPGPAQLHRLPSGAAGPLVGGTAAYAKQVTWALAHRGEAALEEAMRRMQALCHARKAGFLVTAYTQGRREGGEPGATDFPSRCRAAGVPFFSVRKAFAGKGLTVCARRADNVLDPHYNASGARRFAAGLVPALEEALTRRRAPSVVYGKGGNFRSDCGPSREGRRGRSKAPPSLR